MAKTISMKPGRAINPISIPRRLIERRIYLIRGKEVMLDHDLAQLYQVETRALTQAVRRNLGRFPEDFMFRLNKEELENWISQIVISNPKAKMGLRHPPYAFTEQGVAMLSSILRSTRAVRISIAIIRVFVRLREILSSHEELARRVAMHDHKITKILDLLDQLLSPREEKREPMGFRLKSRS